MVRVVSQNFSPPRSRHSSGETDRDLAERANLALSTLGRKRFECPEYESSSDSFWDSELDGDHYDTLVSENGESSNDINGNEAPEKSDVQSKRKERRRERNKLSAQAYRQRRRHQNVKEQQQLMQLETENKRLHKLVQTLENKKVQAKQYLLGCSVPMPDVLQPSGAVGGVGAASAPVISQDQATPQLKVSDVNPEPQNPYPYYHKLTNHHSPQSPSSTCSPMSVDQVLPSPPLALTHAPKKQNPVMLSGDAANYSSFTGPSQPALNNSPVPSTQIIINANVLIGATFSPAEKTSMPSTSVPTFLAVPNVSQNANLNCNPLRMCPPMSHTSVEPIPPTTHIAGHDTPSAKAVSDTNLGWWNTNGNQVPENGNMTTGAVFSLVNVGMCNNNNSNNNANDANGNKSCDSSKSMQSNSNSQQQSFNLNANRAAEATTIQGNHHHQRDQFDVQNPAMVQYYLTSNDQGMTVSVQ